jgi:uncharacterized protein YjeT (DUF2065 family)
MHDEFVHDDPQRTAKELEFVPVAACLVAAGVFGVTCLVLWIPRMWRKTLQETNQLSRAVQGKLDDSPDDRHHGSGI